MASNGRQDRDLLLATAIAGGATVRDAARQLGLGERTAYRRSTEPEFQAKVSELRREMLDQAVGRMAGAAIEAVDTLVELARSAQGETARLQAARSILELGSKLRESLELETRIAELEQRQGLGTTEGRR